MVGRCAELHPPSLHERPIKQRWLADSARIKEQAWAERQIGQGEQVHPVGVRQIGAALHHEVAAQHTDDPRYFQISVPVQPGNSGGPLVDECGNVVGAVTARLNDRTTYEASGALPQNVNCAVKDGLVYSFLSGVPELSGKLKAPRTARDREAASGAAERAAVLVVVE